jgi:hypothetical protein
MLQLGVLGEEREARGVLHLQLRWHGEVPFRVLRDARGKAKSLLRRVAPRGELAGQRRGRGDGGALLLA